MPSKPCLIGYRVNEQGAREYLSSVYSHTTPGGKRKVKSIPTLRRDRADMFGDSPQMRAILEREGWQVLEVQDDAD